MENRNSSNVILACLAAVAGVVGGLGCGSSTSDPGNSSGGLGINASLGIALRNRLIGAEASYATGSTLVTNDGTPVSDAVVALNGATMPPLATKTVDFTGFYSADQAAIPSPIAGSTLTLTATRAGQTATLSLPCPNEVTLTSPQENMPIKEGQVVNVTWNGSLDTGNDAMIAGETSTVVNVLKPSLNFYWWDGTSAGTPGLLPSADANLDMLATSATSGTITVPSGVGPMAVLELHVAGKWIDNSETMAGQCNLSRRVVLAVSAQ